MSDRSDTSWAQSLVATCGLLCIGVGGIALFASVDNGLRPTPPTISPWVGLSILILALVLFAAGAGLREGRRWAASVAVLGAMATVGVLVVADAHPALVILPLFAAATTVVAVLTSTTSS